MPLKSIYDTLPTAFRFHFLQGEECDERRKTNMALLPENHADQANGPLQTPRNHFKPLIRIKLRNYQRWYICFKQNVTEVNPIVPG